MEKLLNRSEPFECSSNNLTEFESVVYVSFNTTAEPSDDELETLASSFVESNNQVNAFNGETCNLSFWLVESALVSKAENGPVNGENWKLGNGANKLYKMFLTDGRCKGCDRSSKATGDRISGRRILESGIPVQKERSEWLLDKAGLLNRSRGLRDA
mmetsp:Transcript_27241/g.49256  ORF Transcript_27241/g.49256 Transcript_27241/m.49256 type:complete len:157 (+) Transcript_27241:801-1271(+)|eukprot:CAMPEP_0202509586 /NCGR_PEP_ID=MMETSP1361-20130828/52849_1 /ASSEMBLY_ACC=CAM_ASM_000849 /TAXON_ID=210615 /ORGANISM="Staurosira complex sp., Strain CCMP2646" /LENGTH=156 /DNA_ID=CAMNT_0049143813 /DNA_START=793 /DNA_END=1263 /DNA_ORIENTATION=+